MNITLAKMFDAQLGNPEFNYDGADSMDVELDRHAKAVSFLADLEDLLLTAGTLPIDAAKLQSEIDAARRIGSADAVVSATNKIFTHLKACTPAHETKLLNNIHKVIERTK